jgi:hypothetical protein
VTASDNTSIQATVTATNCGATPRPEHYRIVPVAIPADAGGQVARSAPRLEHTGAPIVSGTVIDKIVHLWGPGEYFDAPASRRAIADALDDSGERMSTATLNRHLKAAVEGSILDRSGSESRPLYFPTERSIPGTLEDL